MSAIHDQIRDVVSRNDVVLFMKGTPQAPQCGFSGQVVQILNYLGVPYQGVNVLADGELREGIKTFTNWPTIPQLYVGGELIGGSDIVLQMFESGELAEVLGVEVPAGGTPRVEVAADAAAMMRSAMEQRQGVVLHLRIDARWQHALSLAPVAAGDLCVSTGGIDLYMEPWTAARADGLRISMEESLQGTRARFDNPNAPPPVQQMSVSSLKARMDAGEALQLIDVRGPDEREKAAIAGARPWDEATDRMLDALPRDAMVVFHCHKGGRSQKAAEYLRGRGFRNVHNLAGGIDAWSLEIDPAVPRY